MTKTHKRGGMWSYNYAYCGKNGKRVACKKTAKSVKLSKPSNTFTRVGCTKTKNGKRVACTKKEQANVFKDVWNGLFA